MEPVVSVKNLAVGGGPHDEFKSKYDESEESYVKKLEAKLANLEKAHKKEKSGTEQHIAFLESRLNEANRLAKFLNGKKTKMTIEKQQLEEKAKVLEDELRRLQAEQQQRSEPPPQVEQELYLTPKQVASESAPQAPETTKAPEAAPIGKTSEFYPMAQNPEVKTTVATVQGGETETLVKQIIKQITELESRLVIANKVVEYLKKTIADANEKNNLGDVKTNGLEMQIEELKTQVSSQAEEINNKKFKLAESKRILQFASSNIQTLKKEKLEIEQEYADKLTEKSTELSSTKELLEAATISLTKIQEEKTKLEGTLANMDFKLQESNRVSKFMQDTAVRLGEEKKALKSTVAGLEAELEKVQSELLSKSQEMDKSRAQAGEHNSMIDELLSKVEDYESQIKVAKRTLDFLQVNLSQAERENQNSKDEAEKTMQELGSYKTKVNDLENDLRSKNFKLAESKRILSFVQEKVKTLTDEKEREAQEYRNELTVTKNRLTETKRILEFVKSKLNQNDAEYKQKKNDMEEEMVALKTSLADYISTATLLQDTVVRVEQENQKLAAEMSRLTELTEAQEKELGAAKASSQEHSLKAAELSTQISDLKGLMRVTDQLAEYFENEWRLALVKLEERS